MPEAILPPFGALLASEQFNAMSGTERLSTVDDYFRDAVDTIPNLSDDELEDFGKARTEASIDVYNEMFYEEVAKGMGYTLPVSEESMIDIRDKAQEVQGFYVDHDLAADKQVEPEMKPAFDVLGDMDKFIRNRTLMKQFMPFPDPKTGETLFQFRRKEHPYINNQFQFIINGKRYDTELGGETGEPTQQEVGDFVMSKADDAFGNPGSILDIRLFEDGKILSGRYNEQASQLASLENMFGRRYDEIENIYDWHLRAATLRAPYQNKIKRSIMRDFVGRTSEAAGNIITRLGTPKQIPTTIFGKEIVPSQLTESIASEDIVPGFNSRGAFDAANEERNFIQQFGGDIAEVGRYVQKKNAPTQATVEGMAEGKVFDYSNPDWWLDRAPGAVAQLVGQAYTGNYAGFMTMGTVPHIGNIYPEALEYHLGVLDSNPETAEWSDEQKLTSATDLAGAEAFWISLGIVGTEAISGRVMLGDDIFRQLSTDLFRKTAAKRIANFGARSGIEGLTEGVQSWIDVLAQAHIRKNPDFYNREVGSYRQMLSGLSLMSLGRFQEGNALLASGVEKSASLADTALGALAGGPGRPVAEGLNMLTGEISQRLYMDRQFRSVINDWSNSVARNRKNLPQPNSSNSAATVNGTQSLNPAELVDKMPDLTVPSSTHVQVAPGTNPDGSGERWFVRVHIGHPVDHHLNPKYENPLAVEQFEFGSKRAADLIANKLLRRQDLYERLRHDIKTSDGKQRIEDEIAEIDQFIARQRERQYRPVTDRGVSSHPTYPEALTERKRLTQKYVMGRGANKDAPDPQALAQELLNLEEQREIAKQKKAKEGLTRSEDRVYREMGHEIKELKKLLEDDTRVLKAIIKQGHKPKAERRSVEAPNISNAVVPGEGRSGATSLARIEVADPQEAERRGLKAPAPEAEMTDARARRLAYRELARGRRKDKQGNVIEEDPVKLAAEQNFEIVEAIDATGKKKYEIRYNQQLSPDAQPQDALSAQVIAEQILDNVDSAAAELAREAEDRFYAHVQQEEDLRQAAEQIADSFETQSTELSPEAIDKILGVTESFKPARSKKRGPAELSARAIRRGAGEEVPGQVIQVPGEKKGVVTPEPTPLTTSQEKRLNALLGLPETTRVDPTDVFVRKPAGPVEGEPGSVQAFLRDPAQDPLNVEATNAFLSEVGITAQLDPKNAEESANAVLEALRDLRKQGRKARQEARRAEEEADLDFQRSEAAAYISKAMEGLSDPEVLGEAIEREISGRGGKGLTPKLSSNLRQAGFVDLRAISRGVAAAYQAAKGKIESFAESLNTLFGEKISPFVQELWDNASRVVNNFVSAAIINATPARIQNEEGAPTTAGVQAIEDTGEPQSTEIDAELQAIIDDLPQEDVEASRLLKDLENSIIHHVTTAQAQQETDAYVRSLVERGVTNGNQDQYERAFRDRFGKDPDSFFRTRFGRKARNVLRTTATALYAKSPELKAAMRAHEWALAERIDKLESATENFRGFLSWLESKKPQKYEELSRALNNSDLDTIRSITREYTNLEFFDSLRPIFDEQFRDAVQVARLRPDQYIDFWFPRAVNPSKREQFESWIKHGPLADPLQKALDEQIAKNGNLSQTERDQVIARAMQGLVRSSNRGHIPGNFQGRTIPQLTEELMEFYEKPQDALYRWIHETSRDIETRRFFGVGKTDQELQNSVANAQRRAERSKKQNKEEALTAAGEFGSEVTPRGIEELLLDENRISVGDVQPIGGVVMSLRQRGILTYEDVIDIADDLAERFNYRPVSAETQVVRDLTYMDFLINIWSTMRQTEDIVVSAWINGGYNTAKALVDPKIKVRDVYLHNRKGVDFSTKGINNKPKYDSWDSSVKSTRDIIRYLAEGGMKFDPVEGVKPRRFAGMFGVSGFSFADLLGKQVLGNAYINKMKGMSDEEIWFEIQGYVNSFDGSGEEFIRDLREGTVSDDVRFMAFNRIADMHPVTLSDIPMGYLRAGDPGKMWYQLKTFATRRIDFLTNQWQQEVRRTEDPSAVWVPARKIGMISFMWALSGAGVDSLRKYIAGRPVHFGEEIVNNMLKLVLLNRYTIDSIIGTDKGNIKNAFVNFFTPAVVDTVFTKGVDLKNLYEGLVNDDPRAMDAFRTSRSWNRIPIIGSAEGMRAQWGETGVDYVDQWKWQTETSWLDRGKLWIGTQEKEIRKIVDDETKRYVGDQMKETKRVRDRLDQKKTREGLTPHEQNDLNFLKRKLSIAENMRSEARKRLAMGYRQEAFLAIKNQELLFAADNEDTLNFLGVQFPNNGFWIPNQRFQDARKMDELKFKEQSKAKNQPGNFIFVEGQ